MSTEAAARAIACTATGAHSSLPLWEWLPGMQLTGTVTVGTGYIATLPRERIQPARVASVDRGQPWVQYATGKRGGWGIIDDALPDFTDLLTLHGLHALVIRAWTGHEVRLTTNVVDGRCMRHNIFVIAPDGKTRTHADGNNDLALLLVGALEAAPRMSR